MEAAIRFSRNSVPGNSDKRFLKVDVTGKSFQLCQLTKISKKHSKYEVVHASAKVPAFRAFDWHPVNEALIAVGQSGGEATLLNIAEGQQDSTSFSVRSQRQCNAIALNSQNWIGVGLDKVRTDYCLNIWDFNQRLPSSNTREFGKGNADPIHRLAGSEPITSLKFFQEQPKLLLAGVKGQFVRMYDLRESTAGTPLLFATRCVHNLAIDPLDENYFASCYPINDASICIWDRRMISRASIAQVGFTPGIQQANPQPEVSMELKNVIDASAQVWSLRFSKAQRGCLGVLSSAGQLKVFRIGKDFESETYDLKGKPSVATEWERSSPGSVFLEESQSVTPASTPQASHGEKHRVVSFDFMTSKSKRGQPDIITLDRSGVVTVRSLPAPPNPCAMSSTSFLSYGSKLITLPRKESDINIATTVQTIRREAEPRNALRQAFKQSKQVKGQHIGTSQTHRKLSSFESHVWNMDLGYFEPEVSLQSLLLLHSQPRRRCEEGYLLNATRNQSIVADNDWLQSFWSWLEHSRRIAENDALVEGQVDLSFLGLYAIWMEDVPKKSRRLSDGSTSTTSLPNIIRNVVQRLDISRGRGCATEYPHNRALCLHMSGLPWLQNELQIAVDRLVAASEITRAAAMAVFAGEEKMAQNSLRAKNAGQRHKMLAMALASARRRSHQGPQQNDNADQEWQDTIDSLSADLADPYARAILAYVKSGSWDDVVNETSLPLKYRVNIALRHFDDSKLTRYVGAMKTEVITRGDIEGVFLTGAGTENGTDLLVSYASITGDLQTAVLGMNYAGLSDRFLASDEAAYRKVECLRDTYRSQMMSWGLKFEKARFDVACARALRESSPNTSLPVRKKEQVRLVCAHCAQPLSQFGHDQQAEGDGVSMTETKLHPLAPEKAAVAGTACPKCGRHLPRCGVCDMWLGTPDESYSKWFSKQSQPRASGSVDMNASMAGSTITTIGPADPRIALNGKEPKAFIDGSVRDAHRPSETAVEVTDDAAQQVEREKRWMEAMHRFTVFCLKCSHGFHAEHAKLWFGGTADRQGHRAFRIPHDPDLNKLIA